ncbi:MAG: hypothetical protein HXX13_17250 [Bacteroidetes bacterium]|nr:hypothetical protein [Bacteroidota bacterium]
MKNFYLLLFTFCIGILGCNKGTDTAFSYKQSMISSGNNSPDFNFSTDKLDQFLVMIHQGKTSKDIQTKLGWNDEKITHSAAFLQEKGFLRKEGEKFIPTCMIISRKNGEDLRKYAEPISGLIADSIIKLMPTLKSAYSNLHVSTSFPFDSVAFFILSDVLLDNWQIGNVEKDFIHTGRPLHHGKHYYYSFLENDSSGSDPFGIYGNMGFTGFMVFGKNQSKVNQNLALSRLQSFPLVDSADNSQLEALAAKFSPVLLSVLNGQQAYIQKTYKESGYSAEVSFPEFFIWWYHFIYTRTTNILADKGYLNIPKGGNFFYRLN